MEKIKIGSDFSGVGAFDQALIRLGVDYETSFACDMDRYARNTYLLNFGTEKDMELLQTPIIKKIDDIYYRGFVNQKLKPPTEEEWEFVKEHEESAARLFSFYYPWNVYSRVIPEESLDISVHTCPCQSFSLAGKRKGEEDRRGVLFYNSHEFIAKNKPRYFMFENVKGLLSDDNGKTFQRWIDLLGGKSVNGNPVIFPNEESVPYHVYYKVLNAKEHGVPQNRERIFIIGIRDDSENDFNFPKPIHLEKRLKDVLEPVVDEKYFLSDKMLKGFMNKPGDFGQRFNPKTDDNIADCVTSRYYKMAITDNYYIDEIIQLNDPIHSNDRIYSDKGISPTLNTMQGGNRQPFVEVSIDYKIGAIRGRNPINPKSRVSGLETEQMLEINENGTSNALTTVQKDNVVVIYANTKKGYDIATEEDSINFSNPNSETRRGGVGVAQTLDTKCNQGVLVKKELWIRGGLQDNQPFQTNGISPCLTSAMGMGGGQTPVHNYQQRIRKLTPLECFRLMDFNEGFRSEVSDSQKYKQAGNSVVVQHFVDLYSKLYNK